MFYKRFRLSFLFNQKTNRLFNNKKSDQFMQTDPISMCYLQLINMRLKGFETFINGEQFNNFWP